MDDPNSAGRSDYSRLAWRSGSSLAAPKLRRKQRQTGNAKAAATTPPGLFPYAGQERARKPGGQRLK
jgi:hypothetical protein